MSQALLDHYRATSIIQQKRLKRVLNNNWLFPLFMWRMLPMGAIAGLSIRTITDEQCTVTVPYRKLNSNPFRSTYFAVLSMAAEMSTGLPALLLTHGASPSVSMLVTRIEGDFSKKATGLSSFTFEQISAMREAIEQCILTGQAQTYCAVTTGRSEGGEIEAIFAFTWSFRVRA